MRGQRRWRDVLRDAAYATAYREWVASLARSLRPNAPRSRPGGFANPTPPATPALASTTTPPSTAPPHPSPRPTISLRLHPSLHPSPVNYYIYLSTSLLQLTHNIILCPLPSPSLLTLPYYLSFPFLLLLSPSSLSTFSTSSSLLPPPPLSSPTTSLYYGTFLPYESPLHLGLCPFWDLSRP
jgi:hypothetical protein